MRRRFLVSTLLTDLAALLVALGVGSAAVFGTPWFWGVDAPGGASLTPLVGFLFAGALAGSYVSVRMWARYAPRPSYGRALAIVAFSGVFTAVAVVMTRGYWSRPFVGIVLASWAAAALGHRAVRRRRPWTERLVLVTNEKQLVEDLADSAHAEVVAVYQPAGEAPNGIDPSATLVVDLRPVMSDSMAQFVSSWDLAGNRIRSLSSTYEEHTGRLPLVHLVEGWEISAPIGRNEYIPAKRVIDTILVTATAPLWLLLAGVIWAAVRLDSPGPALYHQTRVGRNGSLFTLHKFRTMRLDAEAGGPRFATVNDARLTRVGKWLRRFRIDEIPQLWNVFKGDLSLIGPRPERPEFTRAFEATIPFYQYRHLVRPGVTGWAQVHYGYADDEADTIEKLAFDLFYVKHMSPWIDTQILGKSIWTVLSGFGAQ
jgi:lipopolysaccharide/colanic/teichoic acid biosynthesis glycosyltransferase